MAIVIGWDVGGAHLKAARAVDGRVVDAVQFASPLWLGLNHLDDAFAQAKARLGPADGHAVAMTGELSMAFASRAQGVAALGEIVAAALAPAPTRFYAGRAGWLGARELAGRAGDVASANWHASAALAARHAPDAMLIDMGSTTTDIIPIAGGLIGARGYSDAERLASGELVYAGLARSLVFASANRAPFAGGWTPLMADDFADMADVHRVIGDMPQGVDVQKTTDGRGKSAAESRARLARMVGRDAHEASDAAWLALARYFAEAQLRELADAAAQVLSQGGVDDAAPVVAAGIGADVLCELSRRLGRRHVDFGELIGAAPSATRAATHFAPAAALAILGG